MLKRDLNTCRNNVYEILETINVIHPEVSLQKIWQKVSHTPIIKRKNFKRTEYSKLT